VLHVGGLKHRGALVSFVDCVLLGHLHGGEDGAVVGIDQRHIAGDLDALGGGLVGGQRDRNRPEQAGGHLHAVTDTLPVGMGHEAVERGEAALAHHDDVALFAGADLDLGKRCRAGQFGLECVALEQQGTQTAATVRIDQSHAEPPLIMVFREGRRLTNPKYPPVRLFLFGDKGLFMIRPKSPYRALW